jgi:hypothetical protein
MCPSCGEPLRREDGSLPRTAVALLLGLTAAGALASSCGSGSVQMESGGATSGAGGAAASSGTGSGMQVFYGPAQTTSSGSSGTGGSSSNMQFSTVPRRPRAPAPEPVAAMAAATMAADGHLDELVLHLLASGAG